MTLIEAPQLSDPALSEEDPDQAHRVGPEWDITEAAVMGTPVVAICGWLFVPKRDPLKLPVCQRCREIWESIPG